MDAAAALFCQHAASFTNSSVCSDSCDGLTIDAEPAHVAEQALNRHDEPDDETASYRGNSTTSDSSEQLHSVSRQLVSRIRQQLEQMQRCHRQQQQLLQQQASTTVHRRLDAARLNCSLAAIRQAARLRQPHLQHPRSLQAGGPWVDFNVRVRRDNADQLMRRQLEQARSGGGGAGGGGGKSGGKAAATAGKGGAGGGSPYSPACIDCWTRSCRISAGRRCGLHDALRPLLVRLGIPPGRQYRVTLGAFEAPADGSGGGGGDFGGRGGGGSRGGASPPVCLLDTVGSLADRKVMELFLNLS